MKMLKSAENVRYCSLEDLLSEAVTSVLTKLFILFLVVSTKVRMAVLGGL